MALKRYSVVQIDSNDKELPGDVKVELYQMAQDLDWGNDGYHKFILSDFDEDEFEYKIVHQYLIDSGVTGTDTIMIHYWW